MEQYYDGSVSLTTFNNYIAGVDYEPLRTNVTLGPLQATQNLAVDIIEDLLTERTEEFQVRIIVPEEAQQLGVSLGMPSVLTVRIIDDDRKLPWDTPS